MSVVRNTPCDSTFDILELPEINLSWLLQQLCHFKFCSPVRTVLPHNLFIIRHLQIIITINVFNNFFFAFKKCTSVLFSDHWQIATYITTAALLFYYLSLFILILIQLWKFAKFNFTFSSLFEVSCLSCRFLLFLFFHFCDKKIVVSFS